MVTTSPTFQEEVQATSNKMNDLVHEILEMQKTMQRLVQTSTELGNAHNEQIRAVQAEAEALRRENDRLRKRMLTASGNAQETMNAIAARDAAFKKLRLRGQQLKLEIESLPQPDMPLTKVQKRKARRGELIEMKMEGSPASSSSGSSGSSPKSLSSSSRESTPRPKVVSPIKANLSEPGPSRHPGALRSPRPSKSLSDVTSPPKVTILGDKADSWYLHDQPPVNSVLLARPVSRSKLKQLVRGHTTIKEVDKLVNNRDYPPMRTVLVGARAFTFDPMVVEAPSGQSYLLDWTTQQGLNDLPADPEIFDTCFCPNNGEGAWCFVGNLLWKRANPGPIWQSLDSTDRKNALQRAYDRVAPDLSEQEVKEEINHGDLVLVAWEVSGRGIEEHIKKSKALAERLGFPGLKEMTEDGTFERVR